MKEKLESALKDAISEAVSNVSCVEDFLYFVGNVKFVVDEGWTTVEVTSLKITE